MNSRLFTSAITLFSVSAAAFANLVTNGSFELPFDGGGFTYYSDGVSGGWGDGTGFGFELGAGGGEVLGIDGLQVMAVETSYAQGATQSLSIAAGTYSLSYELGRSAAYVQKDSGNVSVYWDGTLVGSVSPASDFMQSYSVDVTSLGGGDTLLIVGSGYGNGDAAFIDNVQLNAVPEPASMACLGLGAIAFVRRRRAS